MAQELIATRGLSGSGKTTWAKSWVAAAPESRVRINRDDLRFMVFGSYWLGGDPVFENAITKIQHAAILAALKARKSVVVDDTNLRIKTLRELLKIAQSFDGRVQFRIQDFNVSEEVAIQRDTKRIAAKERGVGEDVIRAQFTRYFAGGKLPKLDAEFYEHISGRPVVLLEQDESLPHAWIVDIDGTLARMVGRGPFDYHRVDEDEPVWHVIRLVQTLKAAGNTIIIMSGREDSCETLTREWLDVYEIPYDGIHMRATGDGRKDNLVKKELFDAHVANKFYIEGVLDDRDQVVKMWREMGLFVAQVAYGDF